MSRPLGVTIIAGLLTLVGGFFSFFVFLAVVDSLRLFGFSSILIYSSSSFLGFLLYGALPVLFYITGIGLFQLRPWARQSISYFIPLIMLIWLWNLAYKLTYEQSSGPLPQTAHKGPEVFLGLFMIHLFFTIFLNWYFSRPSIRVLFI